MKTAFIPMAAAVLALSAVGCGKATQELSGIELASDAPGEEAGSFESSYHAPPDVRAAAMARAEAEEAAAIQAGRAIAQPEVPASELLVRPGYYGIDGNQNRCGIEWGGGRCDIPASKTHRIKVYASGDSFYDSAVAAEVNNWVNRLNLLGWNVTTWRSGDAAPTIEIQVHDYGGCALSTNTLAYTAPRPFNLPKSPASTPGYTIYLVKGAGVFICKPVIEAYKFYKPLTTANKTLFIRNVVDHELGHVSGLGHSPGTLDLMKSWPREPSTPVASPSATDYPFFAKNVSPSTVEQDWLKRYVP